MMADTPQLTTFLDRTVQALSRLDHSALLELEREADSWMPRSVAKGFDPSKLASAMKILRMTLDGTAANLRLAKKLQGESELWEH